MSDALKKVSATIQRPQTRKYIYCKQREQRIDIDVCIAKDCFCTALEENQNREGS